MSDLDDHLKCWTCGRPGTDPVSVAEQLRGAAAIRAFDVAQYARICAPCAGAISEYLSLIYHEMRMASVAAGAVLPKMSGPP